MGMEAAACLHQIAKFRTHLWNVSRGRAASQEKRGSPNAARRSDGSRYSLVFKDMMPGTLVQQVQECCASIPKNVQNHLFLISLALDCNQQGPYSGFPAWLSPRIPTPTLLLPTTSHANRNNPTQKAHHSFPSASLCPNPMFAVTWDHASVLFSKASVACTILFQP